MTRSKPRTAIPFSDAPLTWRLATQSQVPTEPCNVHGEPRARLARFFSSSDLPRAALAVDLSEVTPIAVKSPTLLADKDPYNSLKPTLKPEPAAQPAVETAANQKSRLRGRRERSKTGKPRRERQRIRVLKRRNPLRRSEKRSRSNRRIRNRSKSGARYQLNLWTRKTRMEPS